MPASDERDRWENIAAQLDADREAGADHKDRRKAYGSEYRTKNDSSQTLVSDWLADSRGGTRTHDPGIVRAVPPMPLPGGTVRGAKHATLVSPNLG